MGAFALPGDQPVTVYAYEIGRGILPNDYLRFAASDAFSKSKAGADYVVDGSGDDADINTALAEGRALLLTEGTFALSNPVLVQNEAALLFGVGPGQRTGATQQAIGSKLQVQAGFSGTRAVLVQRVADDRPLYGVCLRDFVIDGADVAGVEGILYRSNRGRVLDVHVHQMGSHGVRALGYDGTWDLYDTVFRVQTGDNGATGMFFDLASTDTHLLPGSVLYNNNDNIVIKAGSLQIVGVHTYDAIVNNIRFDGGGSRTKIVGCKIEGAGQHGINIDSTNGGYSDIQIIGNGITTNGDSANNTYDDIIIQGPSGNGVGRTQIIGNQIGVKSGVANKARYGVNLASTAAQGTIIQGNTFNSAASFGTAAVNNAGSSSIPAVIRHNGNWVTEASGTDSVASGTTSKAVTHGLSVTPALKDIIVTLTNNPTVNVRHWVSAVAATTFTVTTSADPGSSGLSFAWQAQVL